MPDSPARSVPLWVTLIAVFATLLMAMGGVIALLKPEMLTGAGEPATSAPKIFAGYPASRNFAIVIMLMLALVMRARQPLGTMLALTALVQCCDVVMDAIEGRWTIVPGVAVLAVEQRDGATLS